MTPRLEGSEDGQGKGGPGGGLRTVHVFLLFVWKKKIGLALTSIFEIAGWVVHAYAGDGAAFTEAVSVQSV